MAKILVSACLLGKKVRYDGRDNRVTHPIFQKHEVIPVCPEVDGGLPIPRIPSEINDDRVINKNGEDVTKHFQSGADIALQIAKKHQIKVAILKANSPSCGKSKVYDGTFSKRLIKGEGVAAKLLRSHGIKIFDETELDEALEYLNTML